MKSQSLNGKYCNGYDWAKDTSVTQMLMRLVHYLATFVKTITAGMFLQFLSATLTAGDILKTAMEYDLPMLHS